MRRADPQKSRRLARRSDDKIVRAFAAKGLNRLFGEIHYPIAMMFDRITFDPSIMGGRACIRGMRIPVSVIVGQLAHGATTEELLAEYPDLEKADVQQALEYAAWLAQEEILPA